MVAAVWQPGRQRQHPAVGFCQDRRRQPGPMASVRHHHEFSGSAGGFPGLPRPRGGSQLPLRNDQYLSARRWLDRADPRITGATMAASELWFAWAVDAGSNRRPFPFVQIARIDATNLTLLENINIFDPDSAICYGALSTNANQEVGISYM